MGPSHRAAALAAASGFFAALVSGQGFYYEDLEPECPAQYNQRYLGCYEAAANPFPWTPVNQDLSGTGDLSKSYIHWITATRWNNTLTPNFCNEACRAHGHKYSALWNDECSCGGSLDYTSTAGAPVTLSDKLVPDNQCASGSGCPGDSLESCGTATRARIFVDPSFEGSAAEEDIGTLVAGYQPLGCFRDPNFPSSEADITSPLVKFPGPQQCFEYCADLGKPLVYMSSNAGDAGQVACKCGQDFGVKAQEQTPPDDGSCSLSCADISVTTCTGQDCCGTANGPFPVYANPALMGCHVPRIPGKSDPAAVTPGWSAYTCFATPASILDRPLASAVDYTGATVTRAATFVATVTSEPQGAGGDWILYGCYGQDYVDQALAAGYVTAPLGSNALLTPGGCAAYCEALTAAGPTAYDYAALAGGAADQRCYCATGVGPLGSNGPTLIQDCNLPCLGDNEQMCGGTHGPIIYARPAVAAGGAYAQSSLSYAVTPVYSCTPSSNSSSSTASNTASTTTSSGFTTSSDSTSSSATVTVSLSSASSSETSTSSAGDSSSDSFDSSSASSTSSSGSSDTSSTSSSAGASDTSSTTNSVGPSDTSSSDSASASDASSTSSAGPSDTSSTTLSSDTATITSSSGTASSTVFFNTTSSTGFSNTTSVTYSRTITMSVSNSSISSISISTSGTISSVGPSDTISTSSSDTLSISASGTISPSIGPSGNLSISSSGTTSTTRPSSSGASGTSSSTPSGTSLPVPGVTTINGDILFGIIRVGSPGLGLNSSANATAPTTSTIVPVKFKRQQDADTGFVGGAAGPVNPASCSDATMFTLRNGVLSVGGDPISVDPGVPFIPFRVGQGTTISQTFTVIDGMLYWFNAAFSGGVADFCQVPAGQVYVTFNGPDDVPAGCEPVRLAVYSESQCVDGEIIPVLPTLSASTTATATGTDTATDTAPTTLPTGIPSEENIYPIGASPTGELCVTVTESWVPGEPTFIHDEL